MYLALLELAMGSSDPMSDPWPWNWDAWKSVTDNVDAPWLSEATPETTGLEEHDLMNVRAFCQMYFSLEPLKARLNASIRPRENHRNGRDALRDWVTASWASWGINEVFDEILAAHGRDLYTLGALGDNEVSWLVSECF